MSELVLIVCSPDNIFIYLVEEYVVMSCRDTTVKNH